MLAAAAGIHAPAKLKSAGFVSAHAPSQLAQNRLDRQFAGGSPNLILLVQARSGTVDQPAVAAAGRSSSPALRRRRGVTNVSSYWTTGSPALRSRSGTEALIVAHVAGATPCSRTAPTRSWPRSPASLVRPRRSRCRPVAAPPPTTPSAPRSPRTWRLAESIAIPLTLVLLILAFGSVVAAALPVTIGLVSILATLAVLWILGSLTDVSIYALNLTTALSLGLAIDYSLLMVSRYREELAAGQEVPEAAVRRSVATAGRTIVFSAAAVAAALARPAGVPGVLPAVLCLRRHQRGRRRHGGRAGRPPGSAHLLGHRVNALPVRLGRGRRPAFGQAESPFWRRVADAVIRRPVAAGLPVVAILVVLGLPFAHVHFGTPDDRVLPTSAAARQVGDALRSQVRAQRQTTPSTWSPPPRSIRPTAADLQPRAFLRCPGSSR